jgi:glycerol-3-phosphate dehydrogenase
VLPATAASGATPLDHNVVVDHAKRRGPAGAYTLGGVKLTTARAAAQDVLARAARFARWPSTPPRDYPPLPTNATDALLGAQVVPRPNDRHWAVLQRIVAEEAVEHLDDLIFRRTNLGDDPVHALAIAPSLCALTERWASEPARELARVDATLPWLRAARKAPARPAIAV